MTIGCRFATERTIEMSDVTTLIADNSFLIKGLMMREQANENVWQQMEKGRKENEESYRPSWIK
uniref:Phage protein n=1 Tax=Heterorhabditis bacteriophora TaxID=37862 RepID=A0A1I7XMB2_HETBA